MSEEDRKKMSDLRQKMQAASPEDREKLQKEMSDLLTKAGITPGQRGQGRGGDGQAAGQGRGGFGGQGRGGPGGFGGGADPIAAMLRRGVNVGGYTEQDSQVQVLLRPGLLADVEIQVEKLPDVIHVPAQAVFQKNGQYLVYVHGKDGKFEPRPVQLVKQSESMMVISSGVQAGEVVAMADPSADKSKKGEKKSSAGAAMGGMGGGK
jgi:multidrug efflux pump subunit AcrA (membrane-fusion protein)